MRLLSSRRPGAALKRPTGGMTTRLLAETKARHPGRRLVASVIEETRSRLPVAARLTSPSSATKTAAREQCGGEATVGLLLPGGSGTFPRRLSITHHSATALAAEKELEKMMPAIGLIASIDPWS